MQQDDEVGIWQDDEVLADIYAITEIKISGYGQTLTSGLF
jgi:hypothetical protein